MRNSTVGLIAGAAVASLTLSVAAEYQRRSEGKSGRRQGQAWDGGRRSHASRGRLRPPPHPLMNTLDADRDGKLSAEEIAGAPAALKKLDSNGDGKLSEGEIGPQPGRFGGPGMEGNPRRGGGQGRRGSGRGPGPDRRMQTRGEAQPTGASPLPNTEEEKKILGVLEDMAQNQRHGMMNVPVEDGRLLRLLTEAVGAKTVVEIGTSNGYSAIWLCLALRTTGGKLITYEIDSRRASLARENFQRAGVDAIVTLVEGDAHEEVTKLKEPIDVLFLDADKQGYIDYLNKLLPLVRPGGLVIAHNMNPRQADPAYVKAITTTPALETLFLHMQGAGVGVTLKKR